MQLHTLLPLLGLRGYYLTADRLGKFLHNGVCHVWLHTAALPPEAGGVPGNTPPPPRRRRCRKPATMTTWGEGRRRRRGEPLILTTARQLLILREFPEIRHVIQSQSVFSEGSNTTRGKKSRQRCARELCNRQTIPGLQKGKLTRAFMVF